MLEFPKGPFLVLHFSLYINDLPDDVICNIAIYADDTTLYSKCDWASDLWQQLELAFELESDLSETEAGSGLLISMLENFNWFRMIDLITLVMVLYRCENGWVCS